jgi:hypothetical protein
VLSALLLVPSLNACARLHQYGEHVFRAQNQLESSILMESMGNPDERRSDLLTQSEQELDEACGPLQRHALTRMRGDEPTLLEEFRALWSTPDCDSKVTELTDRLKSP